MTKLLIIQPQLAPYRIPLFNELGLLYQEKVTVLAGNGAEIFGEMDTKNIEYHDANWRKVCGFYLSSFVTYYKLWFKSDKVIHVADFKYVTFWYSMLFSLFSRKKLYLHGQGGYKKTSLLQKLVYTGALVLSDTYLCYTNFSAKELRKRVPKWLHKKIEVVDNTLYLNSVRTQPIENKLDIGFIGRIREGSNVEFLLMALAELKKNNQCSQSKVHLVGAGDKRHVEKLSSKYPFAIFHGALFTENDIKEAMHTCGVGVYAGDAGLSIVHYMALALPVVVHGNIYQHMGPEPCYIENNYNGLLFKRNDLQSLMKAISKLLSENSLRMNLSQGAIDTYKSLSSPSMGEKIMKILGEKN